ncbi:protein PET100 homolog, mitochondrial isoform X3 [Nomascus leucogenys]|uniref:PET100 cytochrome c oxidase chaperone n=1 Tax=Nomascus leucogenys TaxID=61853 RepID=A0A2I3GFE4_NOMLE|nr:protein PET100 homolog, mitochondrial isoform X3 [Nomascus leucogenys]XP_032025373.1 protein PET100 homolog, mitochondrial isoform X2 [Hylobates moloch]XP_055096268.1 protein PET100 homolog, mitochondrial isoform X2 [Symphalangus syndactylus]
MGVKLEIFRMIIYLTFPVAMFWVSNQAEWFEDHVIQRKRELWPPEKLQEIEEFKERLRKRREEKLLRDAQQNS